MCPIFLSLQYYSVLLDYAKGKITGAMTARVRYLQKEAAALQSQQQRVYEHDLRHEEQIKLAGGIPKDDANASFFVE